MEIVMSYDNNKIVKIFPIVPRNIDIEQTQKNEEFETINSGTLNLIGKIGLRRLSINSIFPTNKYSWIKKGSTSNGWEYIDFIKTIRDKQIPARIIIAKNDGSEWINMACSIDEFNHSIMPSGDIRYTLTLKEYVFVKVGAK